MMRRFLLLFLLSLCCSVWGQQRNIYVERNMKELTVKPKRERYRRKGNPAVELMRRVIAAKGDHSLEKNDYAQYHKYQRLTFALNGITQSMVDSLRILRSPLARRQIEYCPQTDDFILPFHYAETASHHLYRRSPERRRDYILGTNSAGVADLFPTGDILNTVLESVFTDVNVYDDVITLLERKFTSPLSSRAAISFFRFYIEDTVRVDTARTAIQLSFVPQNPQDFGFTGRLWVLNDSTYRVHECALYLPVRSSVNYVTRLVIQQKFTDLPTGQRVLQTDDLFAELGILKGQRPFMVHRAIAYTGYSTSPIPDSLFQASDHRREGTDRIVDPSFWAAHRVDSLSRGESSLDSLTHALEESTRRNPLMYLLRVVIANYAHTNADFRESRLDIGPLMSTVSHNTIDGYRLRLSAQTTARLHPHLFFKGYLARGISSRRWYGMAEAEYSFLRKQYSPLEFPRHSITLQYQNDVFSPADLMWQHGRDKDNVWVSFKTQTVDHLMFSRHYLARYELETNDHLTARLQLKHTRLTPCGALFYRRLDGSMVDHLRTAELTASLRWAPGEEIVNSRQRRRYVNRNNPVFGLAHTVGFKGVFGSDYRYHLTEVTAFERLWLNSYGRIDFNLRAAAEWNRVPFPLLLMPVANNSYIITRDMFCMINNMEFINDRYLSLQVEWDLSGKLLNRIPLIQRLKLREVIGIKALWGHLTSKNDPLRHAGSPDLFEMPSRQGVSIVHPMTSTPYLELNVGLHNIFKIIRIDYVRRLNYLDFPGTKKHGWRFGLVFEF